MRKSSEESLETPITQMIDIVFLLIIFFVVTANVDSDLVDTNIMLAQARNTRPEEAVKANTVTINVRLDNREQFIAAKHAHVSPLPRQIVSYNIALQTKSLATIRTELGEIRQKLGNAMPVLIRSDAEITFSHIDDLIRNAITRAGYSKITIVAEVPAE